MLFNVFTNPFAFKVCGHKAPSALLELSNFDIVNGIGIDSMHCIFLGVVKQLIGLWFNSKHCGEKWYCGNKVEEVDSRLLQIKPPSDVSRVPRSIDSHLKFWKGILIEIIGNLVCAANAYIVFKLILYLEDYIL